MEQNDIIKKDDKVYLLTPPTTSHKCYEYKECIVQRVINCFGTFETSNYELPYVRLHHIDENSCIKIALYYSDKPHEYVTPKPTDKIYLESELDILNHDIEQLNKIYNFKKQQKVELKKYVQELQKDWDYRGTINI